MDRVAIRVEAALTTDPSSVRPGETWTASGGGGILRGTMMSKAFRYATLLALAIVLVGCGARAVQVATLADPQPAFIASVRELLAKGQFARLDEQAMDLQRTRARFPGGDWKLYRFHEALEKLVDEENATDQEWQDRIALLTRWHTARPDSIHAAIALGDAWAGYGWHARGTGFADTVTEEGWQLFRERLGRAQAVLDDARKLPAQCPHLYCALVDLARCQGWERAEVDKVFEQAVALEPLYLHVYSAMARYLTPRWHGERGDWERFADASATRIGGQEGSVIYGHIAWQISKLQRGNEFFNENNVSWGRIRQGFRDREALYGSSARTLNAFCKLAGAAADRQTTRELLARIGDQWDPEVWQERKYFDGYREWAVR